jgi:ubiquinone/menaquinone biosynthesis C-methylase UbiE
MTSIVYSGDRAERATGTSYLERRIEINRAYSGVDFDGWLFDRLMVQAGEDILDVGCGSGAQTLLFAKSVGPKGSVSSLDISTASIELLKSRLPPDAPVQAITADMADLAQAISERFSIRSYSLAHSSYALYYSPKRLEVLDVMRQALKPGGRCAVFTPNGQHGLVDFAARFSDIPDPVFESLRFGPNVLYPYFKKHFRGFEIHHFHNVVRVPSVEILLEFYKQTTYYDVHAEDKLRSAAAEQIRTEGHFDFQKNGYLIIGYVDA